MEKLTRALDIIGDPTFSNIIQLFFNVSTFLVLILCILSMIALGMSRRKVSHLLLLFEMALILIMEVIEYFVVKGVGLNYVGNIISVILVSVFTIIVFLMYISLLEKTKDIQINLKKP